MIIKNINNDFNYEIEKLCRLFLPFEKINITENGVNNNEEIFAITAVSKGRAQTTVSAELFIGDNTAFHSGSLPNDSLDYLRECETLLCVQLYYCFLELLKSECEWGVLTGIRPAKLFSSMTEKLGREKAEKHFKEKFLVSENKLSLCRQTAAGEAAMIEKSRPDSFSLYISIPFCPTRCSYCSFVSHAIDKAQKILPDYFEKLLEEIKLTGDIAKRNNLKLLTVYVGGGTPTTLSAEQLKILMQTVRDNFDLSGILEYTVEAGRPDTITASKLSAIKQGGATRISINPQTMNDQVLEAIGRKHTAEQTRIAFALARSLGFDNINMDLIAGLPTDTADSFSATVDEIISINPESVTVHSLSFKRASTLTKNNDLPDSDIGKVAAEMVNTAREKLCKANIMPYYMYRQSKTVGNLENVGYAKKGYECYYNVYIMDETRTILACGASAVTKLKEPNGKFISRIFNFKYPYEYINQFTDLMSRKDKIDEFYNKYSIKNK